MKHFFYKLTLKTNRLSNKYTTYQWQGYFQTYTALSTVQDLQEQFPRRDDFE